MINDFDFDSFMLCLDVSGTDSSATADMWIKLFQGKILGKIYVFQCYEVKKIVKERYQDETVVWLPNIANNFSSIRETLNGLSTNDVFIIYGGEGLAMSDERKSAANLEFNGTSTRIHFQEDEKWDDFSKEIDDIYSYYQNLVKGIVTICNVNDQVRIKLCKLLENSDSMSISCIDEADNDSIQKLMQEKFEELIREIKDQNIDESLSLISKKSEILNDEYVRLAESVAYYSNGDLFTAISRLETVYDSLTHSTKLFLAELYNHVKEKDKAIRVFKDIYSQNKRQKGLHELGAILFKDDDEQLLMLLQEGLEIWPENDYLICEYANYLAKKNDHKNAAIYFRKLKTPYYELVARVNDMLAEGQTDLSIFNSYIFELVEKNPELKNDAIDKVSKYAIDCGSYYNAWKLLTDIDLSFHNEVTSRLIERKIEILSDTEKASKALGKLKPFRKEKDIDIIHHKRVELLREAVSYYSKEQNGYFVWRNYMECQTGEIWNVSFTDSVISCLKSISEMDLEKLLDESFISKLDDSGETTCSSIIYGLRLLKSGHQIPIKDFSIEEFIHDGWAFQELNGTTVDKIWYRYYCSILASLQSDDSQNAINYALSIFECSNQINNEEAELEAALFLMAWGNIQYRLGNTSEGIVCVVESIYKLVSMNELTPIAEEGLSVVSRFLGNDAQFKSNVQKEKITECANKLSKYNESLEALLCSLGDEAYNIHMIEKLIQQVECETEKEINWAIALSNLISLLAANNRIDEAVNCLKKYYSEAEEFLDMRKDIAPMIYFHWGEILTKSGNTADYMLAFHFFDEALMRSDIRNSVHHQEERAALSSDREKIIRGYICYCGILYSCIDVDKNTKGKFKNKLLELLSKCIPLSIIEQKQYNQNNNIPISLRQKSDRLIGLKREYAELCKKNEIDSVAVQTVAAEIQSITDEFVEVHPSFRSLEPFPGTDWEQIQSVLRDDEVVYQYVLTELAVISVLVTNKWLDVRCKMLGPQFDLPYVAMEKYIDFMEQTNVGDRGVTDYSIQMTSLVAEHLCEYVWAQNVSKIYVIPDIAKSRFPISAVQYNKEFLIDKVESLTNFIDYKQLCYYIKQRDSSEIKIVNKIFGKNEDSSMKIISKHFSEKNKENSISDLSCSDSFETIEKAYREGYNTLAIYGHGVSNLRSLDINGAQCIQGSKRMIRVKEILEEVDFKNLILISCLGGSPNGGNPETSHGTWADIFEKIQGNILTCVWSVPTKETIEMMDHLYDFLNQGMNFGPALLQAQKELKNKGENQFSWAGVEHWIN